MRMPSLLAPEPGLRGDDGERLRDAIRCQFGDFDSGSSASRPSSSSNHTGSRRPINLELLCHLARPMEVGLYPLYDLYRGDNRRSGLLMGYGAIESLDIDPSLDRVRDILMEIAG